MGKEPQEGFIEGRERNPKVRAMTSHVFGKNTIPGTMVKRILTNKAKGVMKGTRDLRSIWRPRKSHAIRIERKSEEGLISKRRR